MQDSFKDVIWTDECSVQLETHKRFCCRKKEKHPDQSPGKPLVHQLSNIHYHIIACVCLTYTKIQFISLSRAKHPVKAHVWAGINKRRPIGTCIMKASWMLHYRLKYCGRHCCLSSVLFIQPAIDLWLTTSPSMHPRMLKVFSQQMESSGGELLLNFLIAIQLRTYGMS